MAESRRKKIIAETRQLGRSALAALHRVSEAASELFSNSADAELRRTIVSVLRTLLPEVSKPSAADRERLRDIFSASRTPSQVDDLLNDFDDAGQIDPGEAGRRIAELPPEERNAIAKLIFDFAGESGVVSEKRDYIQKLFDAAGIPAALCKEWFDAAARSERKQKIIGSGAGVAAALLVLAVFILTATLLKSVIFGLIAAYVMLPVQKFFERRLRARKGLSYWCMFVLELPFRPLQKLAAFIRSRSGTARPLGGGEKKRRTERKILHESVALTVLLLLLVLGGAGFALFRMSGNYVTEIRSRISNAGESPAEISAELPPPGSEERFKIEVHRLMKRISRPFSQLQRKFEDMPLVQLAVDHVILLLQNEEMQQECISWLMRQAGGFFNFAASLMKSMMGLVADLLLTIFFFLLFLFKLAEYSGKDGSARRQSSFLVNSILSGAWLPGASPEAIEEANAIIGAIIARLRVWVKGYLTLVLIDSTVYVTVFYFLDVPCFPILGVLAGCGILLPYLGPVISASITIIVTFLAGGGSIATDQLCWIVTAYLIYNGIIEQFILYPAVIGDSLGLTTLETIVVVLLGAIFAGIPGMIFAMPTASVIKYLAPKVYMLLGSIRKPVFAAPSDGVRQDEKK